MISTLNKTTTLKAYILQLAEFYDLKNCKPSKMILTILLNALVIYVKLPSLDKQKVLSADNLLNFLLFFADIYDQQNATLLDKDKTALNNKIDFLIRTTGAKRKK
jgi:hypothetical protein